MNSGRNTAEAVGQFNYAQGTALQSRPFGVALLVAGWDATAGPVLFHTDPSGTFNSCTAMAIGSGSEGAQTTLQEEYKADISLQEAEVLALSTLKQVMEEKVISLQPPEGNVQGA